MKGPGEFVQPSLFNRPTARVLTKSLRPYQTQAIEGIESALLTHPSTLLVMATGLGKTVVAGHSAKGRTLFLAHLDTLVSQSLAELQNMTGEVWDREQGPDRARRDGQRSVVASIQSLMNPERFQSFAPDAFKRVIVDEAHHYLAPRFAEPIRYFMAGGAKVIGLTATPDRRDGKAMGRLFVSSAVDPPLDIAFGVESAWLSPIEWRPIQTDVELHTPIARGTGDFDQGKLDEEIAEIIAPIIRVAVEKTEGRRTIVFTPGVKAAHAAALALNEIAEGCAMSIDGSMERDAKREIIARHKGGEFQYLINCGVLVEGYDDPGVICMIDAAPTKSRARCAQKVGRITRPWPGTGEIEDAEGRRSFMAASPKPAAVWLDLVFNGSKHELASPVDLLGGSYTEKEQAKARKILEKNGGGNVADALRAARAAIAAAAARAKVRLQDRGAIDPLKKTRKEANPLDPKGPPTEGELRHLKEFGVPHEGMTHEEAQKILRKEWFAKKQGWADFGQREALAQIGVPRPWGMSKAYSAEVIARWQGIGSPREMNDLQRSYVKGELNHAGNVRKPAPRPRW